MQRKMKDKKLLVIKPPFEAFPIGLAYVLSCLDKHNIPFDFIDTSINSSDYSKLLRRNDYLAVASGGLIGQFRFFVDIVDQVRRYSPGVPVIVGGNITKDINPDFLCEKMGINYGVVGEAETSMPYLLEALYNASSDSNDLREIPGLIYLDKHTGKVIKNIPKRLDLQKENILPAWRHFDVDYYSKDAYLTFYGRRSAMPILSGRGCVGNCSFCSPTIGGFRKRPIGHVIEEIEFLNSTYDFEWLFFFNEMFYPTKVEIIEFCKAYKKLKVQKPWACALRADADVDKEIFTIMKEAGCVSTSAGIESGSDKVLKIMNKRTTSDKIRRFFREAKEAGLPCNGTFMVGNDGETEEDVKKTIDMVIEEEMNTGESLAIIYPGTLIYKNAVNGGLIKDEWDYLQKLSFSIGVFEATWTDRKDYVNISDIDNDRFWDVLVKELRRYNTFQFNRFQAKEPKIDAMYGTRYIKAQGLCGECNSVVLFDNLNKLLGIANYCPKCFYPVYFDIYKNKEFVNHYKSICRALNNVENLIVVGTGANASNLLRIDNFGMNYEGLKGFLNLNTNYDTNAIFVNRPIYKIEDMIKIRPEIILIVDDESGYSELLLKLFYIKNRIDFPKYLYLIPDDVSWKLKAMHSIDVISHKKYELIYKAITVLLIYLFKIINAMHNIMNIILRMKRLLHTHGIKILFFKVLRKIERKIKGKM